MKSCPACSALCHDRARFCPSCGGGVEEAPLAEADPFLGLTLVDKYQLKELIGEGGMGRVYRAEHLALEKPVAVKILHNHLIGDERSVARFVAEAREASRLNHTNVVTVMEFGETDYGVMFLVMEYLRGRPLSEIIANEYPVALDRVVAIFRQILLAVGEAHRLGVLHRDLKPDNVFIETLADGTELVKVIDFGIAKRFDQQGDGLTSPGMVCGTPEYMSPEQVQGETLDPRSDVYALGVLLYEMIVGSPPFFGAGPAEIMLQHAEDDPLPPSEAALELHIPASLDAIVLWSLAKHRQDRIESAEEFRRVIDSWLLVSAQPHRAAGEVLGSTCPSCDAFHMEDTETCPACGYQMPRDRPLAGTQYLIESLGKAQVEALREDSSGKATITMDGLHQAPRPSTRDSQSISADRIVGYLPLCGREQELAQVLRSLEVGGSLRIVGEPGLGKSRLLDELASRARDAGFDVIRVAPRDELHWPTPLWPVKTLAAELLGRTPEQVLVREVLAAALAERQVSPDALTGMAELFGVPEPPQRRLDRPARRRESYAALRELVMTRASQKPLALLLEDFEQMDRASQRYVAYLQSLPIQQRLLTVVTRAQPPQEPDGVPQVTLSGLSQPDARDFAELKQKGQALHADVLALLDVAGGNPFFIDQLVRLVHEGGLPGHVARRAELVDARLDRLPMHLRQLLQRVAVHGGRVPIARIEHAFGQPAGELDRQLSALESFGLVKTGEDWVSASHPLLEDTVLEGMPAEVRRQAHRSYLAVLPLGPHTIGAASRHALGGGDDRTVAEVLTMGAGVAYENHDNAKAIQWLQLALRRSRMLWGRGAGGMSADTRFTVEVGRALSEVLLSNGDRKTAEAVLREVQQFVTHEQPALAAAVLMDQARQTTRRGMISSAAELLEQALELVEGGGEGTDWLVCELLYRLGELASKRGQGDRALSTFADGFAHSQRLNHAGNDQSWRFQLGLGVLLRTLGDDEDAEAYLSNALLAAELAGSLVGTLKIQTVYSDLLFRQGDHARARDHLGDAVRCAQRIGDRGTAARLALQLGELSLLDRDSAAATASLQRAVQWGTAVGEGNVIREANRLLAHVAESTAGGAPE